MVTVWAPAFLGLMFIRAEGVSRWLIEKTAPLRSMASDPLSRVSNSGNDQYILRAERPSWRRVTYGLCLTRSIVLLKIKPHLDIAKRGRVTLVDFGLCGETRAPVGEDRRFVEKLFTATFPARGLAKAPRRVEDTVDFAEHHKILAPVLKHWLSMCGRLTSGGALDCLCSCGSIT